MMEKSVFRIVTPGLNPRTGTPLFINFECGIASVEQLTQQLNDGQLIFGQALITRRTEEVGVHEVVGRVPTSVRLDGVARLEVPHVRFVEYEGVPA